MTETLTDWLRAELEADYAGARDKTLTDWLITAVETMLGLAVVVRLSLAAGVWLAHHGEPEAPIDTNPLAPPIQAEEWTKHDAIEVGALCVVVPILFSITYDLSALGEWTASIVYLFAQVVALGFEPLRVVLWELR